MSTQRGLRDLAVVGLGELLWDLLPGGRQLGGAPANFAVMASRLGAHGIIASRTGKDELGRAALELLGGMPVDTRYLQRDGKQPTGSVSVELVGGQPSYTIHEPVAWDFLELTPEWRELAGRADAVCFGSLAQRSARSRETIHAFLAVTRPECVRIFDVNFRKPFINEEAVRLSLQRATILKLNDSEMPDLLAFAGLPQAAEGESDADLGDSDAGPRDSDAGLRDSDAGLRDSDAGPRDSDADPRDSDAGPRDSDADLGDSEAHQVESGAGLGDSEAHQVESGAAEGEREADQPRIDWLAHSAQRLLAAWPMRLVAITLGAHGSLLVTRDEVARHPGIPAKVADTVGAGDAFTAALTTCYLQLAGALDTKALRMLNEAGNRWGSWVASQPGAMPHLPDSVRERIQAEMAALAP